MSQYTKYVIQYGDTLHLIAQNVLNDVNRWMEIAVVNNLDYPFVTSDVHSTLPNVKKPGDSILIPVTAETGLALIPQAELDSAYDRALGQDISLFTDDAVINLMGENEGEMEADQYGDLKTVSGVRNLKQAIIIRFSTPLGSLLRHPNYGSDMIALAGKPKTPQTLQRIKIEIERTIRCDNRVEDVIFDKFYDEDDKVYTSISIRPIGYDTAFKMSLVFGEGGIIEWA